jgi:hypothetical protein
VGAFSIGKRMKLIATKPFSWAHAGIRIEHFEAGQEIDTDDQDLISVATVEGWVDAEKQRKAHKAAPENKAETQRNEK